MASQPEPTSNVSSDARNEPAGTHPRDPWLATARVALLVIAILAVALFIFGLPDLYAQLSDPDEAVRSGLSQVGISVGSYAAYRIGLAVVYMLGYSAVAALIFWRKSHDWMALFVSLSLITFGVTGALTLAGLRKAPLELPYDFLGFLGWSTILIFFYIFPDGRFVPSWIKPLAVVLILLQVPSAFFSASPFSMDTWPPFFQVLYSGVGWGSGIFAQIYRYRRVSNPVQRQQTKWLVFGFSAAFTMVFVFNLPTIILPSYGQPGSLYDLVLTTVLLLSVLLIPFSLAMAILRHRLWEIDIIINRTLVYGALTVCIVGIYVLVVGYLGAVFQTRGNFAVSILAAGLVAIMFQPLRERLQRAVNRLTFGERDDPYRVLARLGRRLEETIAPEAVLPAIVEDIARALRLPQVAIWLADGDTLRLGAAHGGTPANMSVQDSGAVQTLRHATDLLHPKDLGPSGEYGYVVAGCGVSLIAPLTYQGELVGALCLAPRSPGEDFSPVDRRLLRDLATQAGAAAHEVQLTFALRTSLEDLRRSRERLVEAQEEERRRIQRDLHDGLGPVLASIRLRLEACLEVAERTAIPLSSDLERLYELVGDATSDVRRLVYDLRPPVLDQLGLVHAIRQHCERFGRETGIETVLATAMRLPVPAAAEVAAFRVVQEALVNVQKHAQAAQVVVRLERQDEWLLVRVSDDGRGLSTNGGTSAGTGLANMRERAEQLGGTLNLNTRPGGGTDLLARIPVRD